jgi:uncharacterized glyoxalase superfamily protein PhnB
MADFSKTHDCQSGILAPMRTPPRIGVMLLLLALTTTTSFAQKKSTPGESVMKNLTPVIIVDQIEPCLPFWIERLGFKKTAEVPEGDKLGFVILVKGNVEIMYQTRASVAKDLGTAVEPGIRPASGAINPSKDLVTLYIQVEELDPVMAALKGIEVVVPERKTFYGAREFGVREPGGIVVMFAEFQKHG